MKVSPFLGKNIFKDYLSTFDMVFISEDSKIPSELMEYAKKYGSIKTTKITKGPKLMPGDTVLLYTDTGPCNIDIYTVLLLN